MLHLVEQFNNYQSWSNSFDHSDYCSAVTDPES